MAASQHWKSYFRDDLFRTAAEDSLCTHGDMGTWYFFQYHSLSPDPILLEQEEITEARIACGSERLQRKPHKVKYDIVL